MISVQERYQRVRHDLSVIGQEHVLQFWPTLTPAQQMLLLQQLEAIDPAWISELAELVKKQQQAEQVAKPELQPFPVIPLAMTAAEEDRNRRAVAAGEELLRQGQVAVVVVAGGLGSRLGKEEPKGMLAVSPISRRSLFQLHTEKLIALERRMARRLPFLIMTNEANHTATVDFFAKHHFFGKRAEDFFFFSQASLPTFDHQAKLLMSSVSSLALSPDGHGGLLTALQQNHLLETLHSAGVELLYYFQVDNALCRIADPAFLGHHTLQQAEVSSKTVAKRNPEEKVGVFCIRDDKAAVVEYSELDEALRHQQDEHGRLRFLQGSIAIHIFNLSFLQRLLQQGVRLPYHLAHKKVPHIDQKGHPVAPIYENGYKLEQFIFDVLPYARRSIVVETSRAVEFSPIKNFNGLDSPETAGRALIELYARWLEALGVTVPRDRHGFSLHPIEISPLFALDEEELRGKIPSGLTISGDTLLE